MADASSRDNGCSNFRRATRWNRREVLRIGSLAGLQLLLPDLLRTQTAAQAPRATTTR